MPRASAPHSRRWPSVGSPYGARPDGARVPDQGVEIVVPFAPAAARTRRAPGQRTTSARSGAQPILVVNKPGGGGVPGAARR